MADKEEELDTIPNLKLSHWKFLLSRENDVVSVEKKNELKKLIFDEINKENMAPFYEAAGKEIFGSIDENVLNRMKSENEKKN